jgi:hypothetical protein
MSAHDTKNGKFQNMLAGTTIFHYILKPSSSGISENKNLVLLHPLQSLLSLESKEQFIYWVLAGQRPY